MPSEVPGKQLSPGPGLPLLHKDIILKMVTLLRPGIASHSVVFSFRTIPPVTHSTFPAQITVSLINRQGKNHKRDKDQKMRESQ